MPIEPARAARRGQVRYVPPRSRGERGAAVVRCRALRARGCSLRQSARELGVPYTSLRRAARRHAAMGGGPDAQTFFDGAEGQAFLHRLVVVLLLVVVLHGGAGVERVQFILRCLGLDTRIACSRSHLQERAQTMGAQVRAYGDAQT